SSSKNDVSVVDTPAQGQGSPADGGSPCHPRRGAKLTSSWCLSDPLCRPETARSSSRPRSFASSRCSWKSRTAYSPAPSWSSRPSTRWSRSGLWMSTSRRSAASLARRGEGLRPCAVGATDTEARLRKQPKRTPEWLPALGPVSLSLARWDFHSSETWKNDVRVRTGDRALGNFIILRAVFGRCSLQGATPGKEMDVKGRGRRVGWVVSTTLLTLLLPPGCGFGPKTLQKTRLPYNESVKPTSEEQLLLNIVRLRYSDNPSSLAVSNIAAQFELAKKLQLVPFFTAAAAGDFGSYEGAVLPGADFNAADRP